MAVSLLALKLTPYLQIATAPDRLPKPCGSIQDAPALSQSIFEVPSRDTHAACKCEILFSSKKVRKEKERSSHSGTIPFKPAIFSCLAYFSVSEVSY